MKPRLSSNSSIFAKRGDPWVSGREGRERFGRNLETENPDLDQFTRARKAVPKEKFQDPPKPEKQPASFQQRKTNIAMRMQRKLLAKNPSGLGNPDAENPFERFRGRVK